MNQMFVINVIMYWRLLMNQKTYWILNVKGVDYRCILWGITRNEAVNILNNSVLEDKDVL